GGLLPPVGEGRARRTPTRRLPRPGRPAMEARAVVSGASAIPPWMAGRMVVVEFQYRHGPQGKMKPRLQTSLGQQLVLTPQLRQARHLLQLSALELEAEINTAIESNPLLDWDESEPLRVDDGAGPASTAEAAEPEAPRDADFREDDWSPSSEAWQESRGW